MKKVFMGFMCAAIFPMLWTQLALAQVTGEGTSYTVRNGDTLWDIAASALNDATRWEEILKANPQIADPQKLRPGDVIRLTHNNELQADDMDSSSSAAAGNDIEPLSAEHVAAITQRFAEARSDLRVVDVQPTALENIYQVFLKGTGPVYVVGKGDYFLVGDLFAIEGQRIVNITEQAANGPRAELMATISRDDMIVYAPEGEVKASVVIFTDVDCGYCRKLHQEVPRLNELGIEVKYLAYPRAGIGSGSYNKIASAWCADDRLGAMNELKAGRDIQLNVCADNPVADQLQLGMQAGLSGTPAIILESGELIPGYMPADRLAQTLGI